MMYAKLVFLTILLGCDAPRAQTPAAPIAPTPPAPVEQTAAVPAPSAGVFIEDERNTISIFEAAAPATVFVTQKKQVNDWVTRRTVEVESGTGSGFVWDTSGHVVTNFHVLDGGRSFEVSLQDQQSYTATYVGGDPRKDIAVLQIDSSSPLTPIRLPAPDAQLRVGQKTIAIGNPFGLDHTLTTGVISALEREVIGYGSVTIKDMIQTDASINPGNSGGPLVNLEGQILGINTMIAGRGTGIGFAVPCDIAERVAAQIIEHGEVRRAWS